MKKKYIFLNILVFEFIFILLFNINIDASVLLGPKCSVTTEIVEHPNVKNDLAVRVISIDKFTNGDGDCPVTEDGIYSFINYSSYFSIGDKIKAGVEEFSSMTPQGVQSTLHWSEVTYSNNSDVPGVLSFQTNTERVLPVSAGFPDVPVNYIYNNSINYVQQEGIVSGFSDGEFKPEEPITRAEFIKIIVSSRFVEEDKLNCKGEYYLIGDGEGQQYVFPDVALDTKNSYGQYMFGDAGNKFWVEICVAKNNGLVSGYQDGNFYPDNSITVGEASKILSNSYNLTTEPVVSSDPVNRQFEAYFIELIDVYAIPFTVNDQDAKLKRGEMAEFIYNLNNKNAYMADVLIPSGSFDEIENMVYPASSNFQHINLTENSVKYILNSWSLLYNDSFKIKEFDLTNYLGAESNPKITIIIEKEGNPIPDNEYQVLLAQIKEEVEVIIDYENSGTEIVVK